MEDKTREGIGRAIIAVLSSIAAAVSPHPVPKLAASLIAIETGTKAIDCFRSSARVVSTVNRF